MSNTNPIFAMSPVDAAKAAGISRTGIFAAIRRGELEARKRGRRTIIEAAALERYIANLPRREVKANG